MPYLRPTRKIPENEANEPIAAPMQFFGEKIRENIEKCPVAQYIITDGGKSDFVVRGQKTKLGLHIETCGICKSLAHSAPISQSADESVMYVISKPVARKLSTRYRDIDPKDMSQLINALLDDNIMYSERLIEAAKENARLRDKYEDLKAIKANSTNPILFPHQREQRKEKQTALHSAITMLKQTLAHEKELRKKAEDELRSLKLEKGAK